MKTSVTSRNVFWMSRKLKKMNLGPYTSCPNIYNHDIVLDITVCNVMVIWLLAYLIKANFCKTWWFQWMINVLWYCIVLFGIWDGIMYGCNPFPPQSYFYGSLDRLCYLLRQPQVFFLFHVHVVGYMFACYTKIHAV